MIDARGQRGPKRLFVDRTIRILAKKAEKKKRTRKGLLTPVVADASLC